MKYLLIATGGAVGSLLRFLVTSWAVRISGAGGFPWGTFAVNASGSFLIGVLWALSAANYVSSPMRFLLFTGLLGGYTTYSAFSAETMQLFQHGATGMALGYVLLTNVVCITLAFAGFYFLKAFLPQ